MPHGIPNIPMALLQFSPRPRDAEEIPLGTIVATPTGALAKVEGYRGYRRDHRIRLVCRYLNPNNRAFDVVVLLPELVTIHKEAEHGPQVKAHT